MTVHRLGIDAAEWLTLKTALEGHKHPTVVQVGTAPGDSTSAARDAVDVELDIQLHIIHLDVGQGESTLILLLAEPALCKQHGLDSCLMSIVIDGGLESDGGGVLARTLHAYGVSFVDAVIVSHFDNDHVAGITRLLQETGAYRTALAAANNQGQAATQAADAADLDVQRVFVRVDPAGLGGRPKSPLGKFREARQHSKAELIVVEKNDELVLDCDADTPHGGGAKLFNMTCLDLNGTGDGTVDEVENASSIAWFLKFGKFTYYTAGDLPTAQEDALVLPARLTAMKCGHHGAATSTSSVFLDRHKPALAFVSAGKQDSYGHPTVETLLRLSELPDLRGVFVTNCFPNRPFLAPDFLAVEKAWLSRLMTDCRTAAEAWLAAIPDIPDDAPTARLGDCDIPGRILPMRQAFRAFVDTVPMFTASATPALTNDVLAGIRALPDALEQWAHVHRLALDNLSSGFRILATETSPGGECKKDFRLLDANNKTFLDALKEARDSAGYILAFEAVDAGTRAARAARFHLAGDHDVLAHVSLIMMKADANLDDRTCVVAYEKARDFIDFGFGNTAAAAAAVRRIAWEQIPTKADIFGYTPPGSPGRFHGRWNVRNLHYADKKRKREGTDDDDEDAMEIHVPTGSDPDEPPLPPRKRARTEADDGNPPTADGTAGNSTGS